MSVRADDADKCAIAAQHEAGEGERLVDLPAEHLVSLARTDEAVGGQCDPDEPRDAVADPVATLDLFEAVAQSPPFGADPRGR